MKGWLLFLIFTTCTVLQPVSAQQTAVPVAFITPQSVYTQLFDGLPASGSFTLTGKGPFNLSAAPIAGAGLNGWQIMMLSGSNPNAGFATGTGSSTGNAVYSVGVAGSGDRALASLSSSAGIYAFGLVLTNQTGGPLNYFTVGFTAEQWRKGGSGNRNTWSFRYKTGAIAQIDQQNLVDEPGLNFSSAVYTTSAAALVGNLPENQQAVAFTVSGINWKPGEQLLLRWDDADEPGSDDVVGIDNFSFTAGLLSTAPSVTAIGLVSVGTNTAEINGGVNDNYAATAVFFEYDTSALFGNLQSIKGVPDSVAAGTGLRTCTGVLPALLPGTSYYSRLRAVNRLGTSLSAVKHFTTAFVPPDLTACVVSAVTTGTAIAGGTVTSSSTDSVVEKGIVWGTVASPTLSNNRVVAGAGSGTFSQLLTGLPQGTALYARVYAISAAGTTYGEAVRFVTPTLLNAIQPVGALRSNASSVQFTVRSAESIAGLSASSFALNTQGINGAFVSSVTGTTTSFTVTVHTGSGTGTLGLSLQNDSGLAAPVWNKPFTSQGVFTIDKQAPQLRQLLIPDGVMKIGDTVPVVLHVFPDAEVYKISNAVIDAFPVVQWLKKNDSIYTAYFIVTAGGNDLDAASTIPFAFTISDAAGNASVVASYIDQPNDAIDANRPSIRSVQNPVKGLYKMNDTLTFVYRFNEKIMLVGTGAPSLTLTIGTRSRTAAYVQGNRSDSLVFRYIVAADDLDLTGLKVAGTISQSGIQVKDLAGNNSIPSFNNPAAAGDLLVDAVIPVINSVQIPVIKTYGKVDTLAFIFNFSRGVILSPARDLPVVKLTVGAIERDLVFVKQLSSRQLLFQYIIQVGDVDKNGIAVSGVILLNNGTLTDSVGNPASTGFKTPSLANIKVDALSPVFTVADRETIAVCNNNGAYTIGNAFAVTDEEVGELVSWRITTLPQRGSVSLPSFSAVSTGKNIIPAGIVYRPNANEAGNDTLITELTDGIATTQKMVVILVQPRIAKNTISRNQLICEDQKPVTLTGITDNIENTQYKYLWESANDSVRFTAAAGIRDEPDYSPAVLRMNTWFRRILFSGACTDTSSPVKITLMKTGFWTGAQNTNWHQPANWCGAVVPGASTSVYIDPNALYQPIIVDSAWCNDLVLANGAHLTVSGVLAMTGNTTAGDSALHFRNGKLFLNGTTPQQINGNQFEKNTVGELIIENPAGVSLQYTLVIGNSLLLTRGSLQTNQLLHFTQHATIGALANSAVIRGNISIDYPVDTRKKGWQWLGHPFNTDLDLKLLRETMYPGNQAAAGSPTGGVPAFFFFDPFSGNDSLGFETGWKPYPQTDLGENTWKKYAVVRANFKENVDSLTAVPITGGAPGPVISGPVNSGDQELYLLKTGSATYHVLSNPYLSGIDLSRISRGNGIGYYFWTWNPLQGANGGYTCYPFSNKYVLPPFGAFVVKAAGTDHKILFTEHSKTKDKPVPLPAFRSDDAFYVELRLEADTVFHDRLLVVSTDSARPGFDKNDAEKLLNPGVNFYTTAQDGRKLSVDARPVTNETTLPIGFETKSAGSFSIRVAAVKLPLGNTLMLHDKLPDRWVALEADSVYRFDATVDSPGNSIQRFEIATRKAKTDTLFTRKPLRMTVYPVPAKNTIVVKYAAQETAATSVRILDLMGRAVKYIPLGIQKQGQVLIPIADLMAGIYIVELRCGDTIGAEKIIKE